MPAKLFLLRKTRLILVARPRILHLGHLRNRKQRCWNPHDDRRNSSDDQRRGAAFFKVSAQPGASVADGSFTTFTITFTPTAVGFKNANVTIASSDPAGPYTFAIRGEGTTTGETTVLGNSTYILSGENTPAKSIILISA